MRRPGTRPSIKVLQTTRGGAVEGFRVREGEGRKLGDESNKKKKKKKRGEEEEEEEECTDRHGYCCDWPHGLRA